MSILPYENVIGKWDAKKRAAVRMSKRMYEAADYYPIPDALKGRAARMRDCSTRIEYQYCADCGSLHLARTNLCRDRLCPLCAWRLSLQRTGEMLHVVEKLHDDQIHAPVVLLTLTIRNCELSEFSATLERLLSAWRLLTKRRVFTRWVLGYCRSIEITRGEKGTLHPHLHVLLFFEADYNGRIAQHEWCAMWRDALGVDYVPVVDIRRAYTKNETIKQDTWSALQAASVEACKYAIKGELSASFTAPEIAIVAEALAGVRLVAYGGIIRKARKELHYRENDAAADVSAVTIECPRCGSAAMVSLAYTWGTSSYLLAPFCRPASDYECIDPD